LIGIVTARSRLQGQGRCQSIWLNEAKRELSLRVRLKGS
jgi:hypothetical protein